MNILKQWLVPQNFPDSDISWTDNLSLNYVLFKCRLVILMFCILQLLFSYAKTSLYFFAWQRYAYNWYFRVAKSPVLTIWYFYRLLRFISKALYQPLPFCNVSVHFSSLCITKYNLNSSTKISDKYIITCIYALIWEVMLKFLFLYLFSWNGM